MKAVEVKDICKNYGTFQLDHVSLEIPAGSIMGLIGENGAGKTSLLKLILGMIRPDGGRVKVLEEEILSMGKRPELKENVGVVLDEVNLPYYMTGNEIGKMMGMIYKQWDQDCFANLLTRLKVSADKKFGDMSRGNKMKLGLVCALSHKPKLLLLDEATAGLDPVVRDDLLDLLMDFTRDEDHAVLMSSHIVSDLEKACDYIAFLREGRMVLVDEKDRLEETYGILRCSKSIFSALDQEAVIGKRENSYMVECLVKKDLVSAAIKEQVSIEKADIEDLFVMMVKGDRL